MWYCKHVFVTDHDCLTHFGWFCFLSFQATASGTVHPVDNTTDCLSHDLLACRILYVAINILLAMYKDDAITVITAHR